MQEAMEWLLRLRERAVSEADLAEWTLWYESDERHKQAFDQMQRLWAGAGALAEGADGAARVRRLLEPSPAAGRRPAPRQWRRLALAASLLAAVLGVTLLARRLYRQGPPAAGAAPLVRNRTLPDGTTVELAPGTRILVRYTAAWRRVELFNGDAYFTVRHDASRPFVVSVDGLSVRDVGTAFDVHEAAGRTIVTVIKGEIEVSPGAAPRSGIPAREAAGVRVSAGEQVKWGRRASPVVGRGDTGRALAWRQGRLEYVDEPLSSVIADVDRYTRHPVLIRDPAVGRIAFTGTVLTRYADEWVQALPSEFPLRLVSRGRSLLLERRPDTRH